MTTSGSAPDIKVNDPLLSSHYLEKLDRIIDLVLTLSEKSSKDDTSLTQEDKLTFQHVKRLKNTVTALRMRFILNGRVDNSFCRNLELDITKSGFPVSHHIRTLETDIIKAEEMEAEPNIEELKGQLVDGIFKYKHVDKDLQLQISEQLYLKFLRDMGIDKFFLKTNPAEFFELPKGEENGNRRFLAHWAVYDHRNNFPNIYILMFEHSGEGDPSYQDLAEYLVAQSLSSLRMIQIAESIDQDFPFVHPKYLKRIHIGPLSISGITQHQDAIEQIIQNLSDTHEDWMMEWATEVVLSKGTRLENSSSWSFGAKGQQRESYLLDTKSKAADKGASEIYQAMIIPYRAFQILNDQPDHPLNNYNSYVVSDTGKILYM
ncbi:hypothetical protein [Neptuniibacter sp. QD37_11]|uniref:hypothetical protein n=1 Tax=Neptuniibacter sp. QD37_11 TaxID=3398209 RepID=UPI0039F5FBA7